MKKPVPTLKFEPVSPEQWALRYLAAQSAHIRETVRKIVEATADDGGPRGQERLRKRIDAAGAVLGRANVRTELKPGKRGKYKSLCSGRDGTGIGEKK